MLLFLIISNFNFKSNERVYSDLNFKKFEGESQFTNSSQRASQRLRPATFLLLPPFGVGVSETPDNILRLFPSDCVARCGPVTSCTHIMNLASVY